MKPFPPLQIGRIGRAGIHSAGFSILNLSPALWLDASDLSTITQSASAVSQWDDKSGNGHHAIKSTGSEQPATGTRTINGLNALDFDGINDNMDINYSSLFSVPSGDNTVIVVWQTDTSATVQRIFSGFVSGGTRWGLQYRIFSPPDYLNGANSASSYDPVNMAITADTNPHIDFMRRNAGSVETGRDGITTTGAKGVDVTVDNIRLGATLGATSAVNGIIAEVLVFEHSLSNSEMNKIGQYLSNKWGISWTNI